jgi:hypothetical protein
LSWVVFAAAFALYAIGASPALGWYDAPEFVAAAVGLGVPHSPGHPLPVALGSAATLIPVGDLAFRVNLASALASAAAVASWAAGGRALLARVAPELPDRARVALAAAMALVLAASYAAMAQAVRAEVYGATSALVAAGLAAVLAWDGERKPRWLIAAGLAFGLALTTHHLIAVMALIPAAGFVLLRRERPGAPLAAVTALAGMVGLAAFLYLPVRSAAGPALDWGAPHAADRLLWTISGAVFADNAGGGHASPPVVDAAQSIAAVGEAASLPLVLLALLGASLLLLRPGHRRVALFLLAVILFGAAGRALFGFDPDTPDDHGYLLPAAFGLVLLATAGAAVAATSAGRRAGQVALGLAAAALIFAGGRAVTLWPRASLGSAHASDDLARAELEALPPRALLVASYYQTEFRVLALVAVEGTRPDVAVLHRGLLTLPGAREAALARHPDLAAVIAAPLAADHPTPAAELAALDRPVLVELDPSLAPAIDAPIMRRLISRGRFAELSRTPVDASLRDQAERAESADPRRARLLAAGPAERGEVERVLLWLDVARLDHYCRIGRQRAAADAFARAWELFPGDVMLEEQAARCGLTAPR